MIITKLRRFLPANVKVDVTVSKNAHLQEEELNKQLADKERVSAALENMTLLAMINSKIED